jgi:phenylalanyl-tRNA synthetase beta chain
MRVPVSWLREFVALPQGLPARELGAALVRVGLEVETVEEIKITGPLVVGRVLDFELVPGVKKPIRWCQVDVGGSAPRGIICGAGNFAVGDAVVVALPGAVLPGGFTISARTTYGRVSDGMICSVRELGIGEDHAGILVLTPGDLTPGDPTHGDLGGLTPGADALALLQLPDAVLDIAVTADRGYCLSMRGMAREAAHALALSFADPALGEPPAAGEAGWPVQVADPAGCDRFAAWTVTGLDPAAPSPLWMRRRLALAGMRPISLAVDVTNYVMLELGQPMHAYDRGKLTGEILVRRAVPGEKLETLDGTTRALTAEDLLVTDESGPIGLAGVMGGASTEIDAATGDIVLEAAHWDPPTIMRMARRHRLPSEASRRFERGVDPDVAVPALARAATLLAALGGASLAGRTVVGDPRPRPHIALAADRPGRVAGREIPTATVVSRLAEVGCEVEGEYTLAVVPPSWRPDIADPADLVEEVLRLEGYDQVTGVLPLTPAGPGLSERQRAHRAVGRALAAEGYVEVLSFPFVAPGRADDLGLPADDPMRSAVRLVNPLSDEQPLMRTSLLPGLLDTLARNLSRGLRDVALFETGLVFLPRPDAAPAPVLGVERRPSDEELAALERALPIQPRHVAVALAGELVPAGWWGPATPASWADAVQAARTVVRAAGLSASVRAAAQPPWHPGRCAEIVVGGRVVGHAGELHPRVLATLELPPRTAAMELDLDALGAAPPPRAPHVSAFPPALLDVALVVDDSVPAASVEAALRDGAGELLESIRLFDLYTDAERVGAGRKSLAYALRFRAPDRTLTVEEANAAKQAAVAAAAERTGAVLR